MTRTSQKASPLKNGEQIAGQGKAYNFINHGAQVIYLLRGAKKLVPQKKS